MVNWVKRKWFSPNTGLDVFDTSGSLDNGDKLDPNLEVERSERVVSLAWRFALWLLGVQ
jgi:hypothetical protein